MNRRGVIALTPKEVVDLQESLNKEHHKDCIVPANDRVLEAVYCPYCVGRRGMAVEMIVSRAVQAMKGRKVVAG